MQLPIDPAVVEECRAIAAEVAGGVHSFIDRHTTSSIERTVLRAYGVQGADPNGVPLVNTCVDRFVKAGGLARGIAYFLGRELCDGANSPQEAAEKMAYAERLAADVPLEAARRALVP